jgi:Na+-driven multidrug efflux pump
VGIATAFGNLFTALALVAAIRWDLTEASFARPSDLVITRQLLVVSAPRIAEGMAATVAEFPFNAILLAFGTEVNAAYQIGRRVHQQVTSPSREAITSPPASSSDRHSARATPTAPGSRAGRPPRSDS